MIPVPLWQIIIYFHGVCVCVHEPTVCVSYVKIVVYDAVLFFGSSKVVSYMQKMTSYDIMF